MEINVIALTGGIASGKSIAADYFKQHGIPVIDADHIAREVVEPGTEGLAKIIAHFGTSILKPNNELDRKKLRTLIFENPNERLWLEALLHPLILAHMAACIKKLPSNTPYAIAVIPLLTETKRPDFVKRVLVIEAPIDQQKKRLCERDHLTSELAAQMLAAQASNAERRMHADDLIENKGNLEEFFKALEKTHEKYKKLFK